MMFTNKDILLRLREKAYVHMPVWVDVEVPMNPDFSYPFNHCMWDFGGYSFEVRRDGRLLPMAPKRECSQRWTSFRGLSGRAKLPLHLSYQFDAPGNYEIRLSGPLLTPDLTKVARIGHSDWIQVVVEAHPKAARVDWLREIERKAANPAQWQEAGELIPSLIAWPDEMALAVLLRFLPPLRLPQPVVRPRPQHLLQSRVAYCFAPEALAAFPDAVVRRVIPSERLRRIRALSQETCW